MCKRVKEVYKGCIWKRMHRYNFVWYKNLEYLFVVVSTKVINKKQSILLFGQIKSLSCSANIRNKNPFYPLLKNHKIKERESERVRESERERRVRREERGWGEKETHKIARRR